MTESKLEYVGPPNQDWLDEEGQKHVLVVGKRYPMSETLAAYLAEHGSSHWKRPNAPVSSAPAAKES